MKCASCHKNTAVVFVTKIVDGKQERVGLCLPCAQAQGLAPIEQLMEQSGMSSEDFENINEQMAELFGDMGVDPMTGEVDEDSPLAKNGLGNLFSGAFSGLKNKNMTDEEEDEDDEFVLGDHEGDAEFGEPRNGGPRVKTKKPKKKKRKYLDSFGINLTDKARNYEVDRIVGRTREIDRAIQILNRRTKNNPVLIGEPGVGKTAIAEGLAVRIFEKQVPAKLLNTEIYLLDLTSVVAGTQFRGQFESRMKAIIKEATEDGNIILVIDEVHTLVGAGEAEGGSMNAANILKPALARGEVQIIGATTLNEYRKHIEKDAALERRFQPIIVDEPSVEESIDILKGIKDYYEDFHKVKISDDVIAYAVNMSERYIHDRFLPDKAIDVIDEAGSRANLKNLGLVELEALKQELRQVMQDQEQAAADKEFQLAADYRMHELRIKDKIAEIEEQCQNVYITEDDIAFVIEAWTKIPVQSISEDEAFKLVHLEDRLHRRLIGQDDAVKAVSKAIRRNRSGFKRKKRPASFIFVGPTGVGKTELTKALAVELFNTEEAIIRFDMSEFMEKHTVSKLIGAPPGYVGYDQAGQLTEKVRRKPYSVILLDEIEKAHPDIFNLLLQILEDGRLTDSQGRTVNFENTMVIMTSNAGTSNKGSGIGFGKTDYDALTNHSKDALKEYFKPEFINRIDDIIVFNKLTREELTRIADLMVHEVEGDAKEKGIDLEVTQALKDYLIAKGFDDKFGARPLRRTIQQYVEDELAEMYIKGEITAGSHVFMDYQDGQVVIQK